MDNRITVRKASNEERPFSEEKLRSSLRYSGADESQINFIIDEIKKQLYDGITTKKIYTIAFSLLKSGSRHLAARYHLKQAIMELGPSGFPFEKYVAELLKFQGYRTQIGQILQGKCVKHEIDIIAEKDNKLILIECKYHNRPGISCTVKIPLYIHARFNDVEAHEMKKPNYASKERKGWVVTNTKFTEDAIQYGSCSGLYLLGWDQPFNNSLKHQIDTSGLYPITCITSLTGVEKQRLLDREIVLCKELQNNEKVLTAIGVKPARVSIILNELHHLCKTVTTGKQHSNRQEYNH